MKNMTLFFLCFMGYMASVSAQESLFPEWSATEEEIAIVEETEPAGKSEEKQEIKDRNPRKEETQPTSELKAPNKEQQVQENKVEKKATETPNPKEELNEEEAEDEKDEKIYFGLTNIKATLTEVSAVSHCTAEFMMLNGFHKRALNNFTVTLTIGSKEKKFEFKNLKPLSPAGKSFMMIGENCAALTKTPAINIQKCQLQGFSEKKCKEKAEYQPIKVN